MARIKQKFEWLSMLDISGPFLSTPVLSDVFPQGLENRPELFERVKIAYQEWKENQDNGIHREWIRFVLREILQHPDEEILEGQQIPEKLRAEVAEHHEVLRPDLVLKNPSGRSGSGDARVLIQTYNPKTQITSPLSDKNWKESPPGRMAILLRNCNVRLGLITNGEHWMLVNAPRGETPGYISWYVWLWQDERETLRAFHSLLGATRIFGVAEDQTLEALLDRSAEYQQQVTEQLGLQARFAVEILVQSIDRSDREYHGELLRGIPEKEVYEAAVTFMMRLVFLFSAEERGLLPLANGEYAEHYAASTLRDELREAADQFGEEVLERRKDAWQRLLASFRAVHSGINHEDLHLPPYGGHLFAPDRYPFLEGRIPGTSWKNTQARPLPINNRTVLHVLDALQSLKDKSTGEFQRLSFRSLDIEQIGHVYEGLLDHTVKRAADVVLGLSGKSGQEPEVELSTLEELQKRSKNELIDYVKECTGRTTKAIQNALDSELSLEEQEGFLIASENSQDTFARISPFAALIRKDSYGDPTVITSGSLYVTEGRSRRTTQTYYTPRSLTESIVQHTLDPLVFEGPAEGAARDQWKLKAAREILSMKICDFACGSAAFLVQACRYLSERLVESWEKAEAEHPGKIVITPEGELSDARPTECIIPRETEERLAIARRLIADRCLYGVDRNPMAVEMAKLSLWLITLQKDRPFTFLDHSIKCGDSLLGISDLNQLKSFHMWPEDSKRQLPLVLTAAIKEEVLKSRELRMKLEEFTVIDIRDANQKEILLSDANQSIQTLKLAADALIATCLSIGKGQTLDNNLQATSSEVEKYLQNPASNASYIYEDVLTRLNEGAPPLEPHRRPFHWPLEFPEIFDRGDNLKGFDALVSNPPFLGGQKITGTLGTDYRDYLVEYLALGKKGSADLCSYFFLRAHDLLRPNGTFGLLATNTIAQGDTREVGLEQLTEKKGSSIYRAIQSQKWPGSANLQVAHVWIFRGGWRGKFILEDTPAIGISPFLSLPGKVIGKPYRLAANAGKSFIGSCVYGMGFILEPDEAQRLIERDPRNKDVLFPYLNGEDLNSRPDQSPSRWVINFFDWPLNRTASGSWLTADLRKKEWLRAGIVPSDYPEQVAADYPDCLRIIENKVKLERMKLRDNSDGRRRKKFWWKYGRETPALAEAIAGMERVLVVAQSSRFHSFTFVSNNTVFSHKVIVFSLSDYADFATLSSNVHMFWIHSYGATLRVDPVYAPTDCFETFPFPKQTQELTQIGKHFHQSRKEVMDYHSIGLTGILKRINDKSDKDKKISQLRESVAEIDRLLMKAYGWTDVTLSHEFRETKFGRRFVFSEKLTNEILDRLLELNHRRHEQEAAASSTDKTKKTIKDKGPKTDVTQMHLGMESGQE